MREEFCNTIRARKEFMDTMYAGAYLEILDALKG